MRKIKIFAFGSFKDLQEEEQEKLSKACKELGVEIAKRGHKIALISPKPTTIDYHIIEGIKSVKGQHSITIWRAEKDERSFSDLEADNIEFIFKRKKGPYPISPHFYAIKEADVVLTLGGTHPLDIQIGHSALALEKPILPIPSFNGAAKQIWDLVFEQYYRTKCNITDEEASILREKWSKKSPDTCINVAEKLVKHNPFRSESFIPQLIMLVSLLVLVFAWVAIFTNSGSWNIKNVIVFFLLLGISALLGTGLRSALRIMTDELYKFSVRNLLNELVVGILLAFSFALVYFAGGIILTGDFVSLTTNKDFNRVAITLSLIGIATSFLIESAVDNLRGRLEKIIKKDDE